MNETTEPYFHIPSEYEMAQLDYTPNLMSVDAMNAPDLMSVEAMDNPDVI